MALWEQTQSFHIFLSHLYTHQRASRKATKQLRDRNEQYLSIGCQLASVSVVLCMHQGPSKEQHGVKGRKLCLSPITWAPSHQGQCSECSC
jgi:hypothetical protein